MSLPMERCAAGCAVALLLAGAVNSSPATAAIIRVGAGSACDHATIQAAVDAAHAQFGADEIRIASNQDYTAQHVNIVTDQDLHLIGGYANCLAATPQLGRTTLDGAGSPARPVITIRGSGDTRLSFLRITGGDQAGSDPGGGIYAESRGTVRIDDAQIDNNIAGAGGGIYALGDTDETGFVNSQLVLGRNVTVLSNTARESGGGIVAKSMHFEMSEPGSTIVLNRALGSPRGGYGGGLVITSDPFGASARIGTAGAVGLAINGNEALYGGGIAVLAPNGSFEHVRLQVAPAAGVAAVGIANNVASVAGGAIYAFPDKEIGVSGDANVFLSNVDFRRNVAPEGAVVYLTRDSSLGIGVGGLLAYGTGPVPAGGMACARFGPCGIVEGNETIDIDGMPTEGALFFGTPDSSMQLSRLIIRDNRAGYLVRSGTLTTGPDISHSEITRNTTTRQLIHATGADDRVKLANLTIADNQVGAPTLIHLEADIDFQRSLVRQPGKATLAPDYEDLMAGGIVATERASFGADGTQVLVATARFVDAHRGDYQQRAASPGVDLLAEIGGLDLLGAARGVDLAFKANLQGPHDVGAYERQQLGPLLLNGDFDADVNLWTDLSPGDSMRDASQNRSGPSGSGVLAVSAGGARPNVAARRQCVHLPGPGRYELNAWGKSTGTVSGPLPNPGDRVLLRYEFRSDGGEACNAGIPTRQSHLFLSNTSSWIRPADAATIDVTPADWTRNSSITVFLVVESSTPIEGRIKGGPLQGWFDGVTLVASDVPAAGGFPFADGFED
jgi:hypothetical protein